MNLEAIIRSTEAAQRNLDRLFEELQTITGSSDKNEFFLLRLQAATIQFEFCVCMVGLVKTEPASFSRKVALKELIHKVYEYKKVVTQNHMRRISALAEKRGLVSQVQKLKETSVAFKHGLNAIEKYKPLRDTATGHYDPDIEKQVSVVNAIDEGSVWATITRFLNFNLAVLKILQDIGKNKECSGVI